MMKNKVLIKIIVPEIDEKFDIFIPVNELIWKIKKLIIKSINDLTNNSLYMCDNCFLINKLTSQVYSNNEFVINTDIRNATELILILKSQFTLKIHYNIVNKLRRNPYFQFLEIGI